jgi:hypothetical protein
LIATALIQALGLNLEVFLNKGAVMILPQGVDKATGLRAAISPHMMLPTLPLPGIQLHGELLATGELGIGAAGTSRIHFWYDRDRKTKSDTKQNQPDDELTIQMGSVHSGLLGNCTG